VLESTFIKSRNQNITKSSCKSPIFCCTFKVSK